MLNTNKIAKFLGGCSCENKMEGGRKYYIKKKGEFVPLKGNKKKKTVKELSDKQIENGKILSLAHKNVATKINHVKGEKLPSNITKSDYNRLVGDEIIDLHKSLKGNGLVGNGLVGGRKKSPKHF
jgi:hypothetical protein